MRTSPDDTAAGHSDIDTTPWDAPVTWDEACKRFHQASLKIRDWQLAQRPALSDTKLLEAWPRLGSTKTFKRALEADFDGLANIDSKWMPVYELVCTDIESQRDSTAEVVYHDLPFLQPIMEGALRLAQVSGARRFMIIEGDTGHGKSFALRAIRQKLGERCLFAEADESWLRPASAAGGMLAAIAGIKSDKITPLSDRLELLKAHLLNRRIVEIDELHHFSGPSLNILKTLINQTNSCIIGAGMKTLIGKLTHAAQEEARQLTHNRLFARFTLTGPDVADARMYLGRRLELQGEDTQKMARALESIIYTSVDGRVEKVPMASKYGGMAYLRNIADQCIHNGATQADATALIEAANSVRKMVAGR